MTFVRVGLTGLAVVVLAGCASEGPATSGGSAAPDGVYDGPMQVDVDDNDGATVLKRSGAAGRALECDSEAYAGGSGDYTDGLETVQDDPEAALDDWLGEEFIQLPHGGYRVEREDDGRVLLSYDVDGRTKAAVIAADGVHDWEDDEGWGVETWAQCDPSELPAAVTEELGIGVWHTPDGDRVPSTEIRSFAGPEHCDWQDITFLTVRRGTDEQQYLRDTDGELGRSLTTTYDDAATVPRGATDTGYERDGRHLWLDHEGTAAYLVSTDDPADVERWPATKERVACA
jgi:hypothetical protein